MQPDDPTGPSLEKQIEKQIEEEVVEEQRRNADGSTAAEAATEGCGSCDATPSCDLPSCDLPSCDLPSCDLPGCDLPACNLLLFVRLSSLLFLLAAVVPERGGASPVRALLRLYRRHLTRFTPVCPSTPSCSAYATAAVETLGVRRGLTAAARRVQECGSVRRP